LSVGQIIQIKCRICNTQETYKLQAATAEKNNGEEDNEDDDLTIHKYLIISMRRNINPVVGAASHESLSTKRFFG
jgi:hypothetical protein